MNLIHYNDYLPSSFTIGKEDYSRGMKRTSLHNHYRSSFRKPSLRTADGSPILVIGRMSCKLCHSTTCTPKGTAKIFHTWTILFRNMVPRPYCFSKLHENNHRVQSERTIDKVADNHEPHGCRRTVLNNFTIDSKVGCWRSKNRGQSKIDYHNGQDSLKGLLPLPFDRWGAEPIHSHPREDLSHEDLWTATCIQKRRMNYPQPTTITDPIFPLIQRSIIP
mmetsp:Transcript_23143/g.41804  ORF Transcript_23143/g.41804 Transcript_23143/m.41804 type:complete len:220 (-) Transcript_23143:488-1147(-)